MSAITNIYDPATQIEDAIAAILTDNGLTAITAANIAAFQQTRPRVEIIFEQGADKQSYHSFSSGPKRNASWDGQLSLLIITNSDTAENASGLRVQREYMATVKYALDNFPALEALNTGTYASDFNGHLAGDKYLPCHKVQRIQLTALTPIYKASDGTMQSKPVYSFEFGVDRDAWTELGLTPT